MLLNDLMKAGFAVLVLVLATAMLHTKALTGAEWVEIASATLWAYLLAHVAAIVSNGALSYMADAGAAKLEAAKRGTEPRA